MSTVLPGWRLRFMRAHDIRRVREIECALYMYPWAAELFSDCLQSGCDCRVGETGGDLYCYGILSVHGEDAHLMNLAVRPDFQGRGHGRRLLRHMQRRALSLGATSMLLEVRPSNARALNLYLSAGYRRAGVRCTYYPAPWGKENAYLLRCHLKPIALPRSVT